MDNTISRLGLTTVEQEMLDCYMGGMSCKEIADFLGIDRVTVWRRRQRMQMKYKTLSTAFNLIFRRYTQENDFFKAYK